MSDFDNFDELFIKYSRNGLLTIVQFRALLTEIKEEMIKMATAEMQRIFEGETSDD